MSIEIQQGRDQTTLWVSGPLTHLTTSRLVPPRHVIAGKNVVLDLTRAGFTQPFGLVYLYAFIDFIHRSTPASFSLKVGRGDVSTYLRRMRLVERVVDDFGARLIEGRMFPWFERQLHDRLIELSVRSVEDEDMVDQLSEQFVDLIHQRCRLEGDLVNEVRISLQEAISNVVVHSGKMEVIVAAQSYGRRLLMAIGDLGVGIPVRLRKGRVIEASLEDHHAIERALKAGVSTRLGRGGLGLPTMVDLVQREDGRRFSIRSGRGHVSITQARTERMGRCDSVAGTILEIAF